MRKVLLASVALGILFTATAQEEVKYEKLYYKDSKVETNDLVITVDDAVSTAAETKFKLKITNKTADYIIYKPEESKFIINGKEFKPTEKWLIILPNESDFRVVNLKGADYNAVKNYSFVLDGLYKVPSTKGVVTVPDFKLPPSQNDFKADNFSCTLVKLVKESDKTEVKFKCAYNGNKIGFVFPSKASVKMPDGKEYANGKSKSRPILLLRGESDDFILKWDRMEGGKAMDMQIVEMIIKWNETFLEADTEKMKSETIELGFDEVMSKDKR